MEIFKILLPASPWPVDDQGAKWHDARALIELMKMALEEATLALDLQREAERIDAGLKHYETHQDRPAIFWRRAKFLHARSFVFAFDNFANALQKLSALPGASVALEDIKVRFKAVFPDVKGIRDTAHHLEDRARNLDRDKNQIQRQPVPGINPNEPVAPGGQAGSLITAAIQDGVYGSTLGDGSYGKVTIGSESVKQLSVFLQEILDSFNWEPTHHIRATFPI